MICFPNRPLRKTWLYYNCMCLLDLPASWITGCTHKSHCIADFIYIYIVMCNLYVSLYLFPCLTLFFTMRKIYTFIQGYFDLNKDCLTTKWIISIQTSWTKVVFREIWCKFFRCPHLLDSSFSEFNTEGKPHSSWPK